MQGNWFGCCDVGWRSLCGFCGLWLWWGCVREVEGVPREIVVGIVVMYEVGEKTEGKNKRIEGGGKSYIDNR